jgi:hypothetical protein
VKVREALIDEARATIAKAKEETCPKAAAQERIGNIWDAQDKQEAY